MTNEQRLAELITTSWDGCVVFCADVPGYFQYWDGEWHQVILTGLSAAGVPRVSLTDPDQAKKLPPGVIGKVIENVQPQVQCDDNCGALLDPQTLEEYKAALDHWANHDRNGGCSHGR